MTTFSVGTTARAADETGQTIRNLTISDGAATTGQVLANAQTGGMFLVKNPDGSLQYYQVDTERSIIPTDIVLKPVS